MELSDERGDERSFDWSLASGCSVTTGVELEVGGVGVTGRVSTEITMSIEAAFGQSETVVKMKGQSANLCLNVPPHYAMEASMLVDRVVRRVPIQEIYRDKNSGNLVTREFKLVSKRGLNPTTDAYPIALGESGSCDRCGVEFR